MRLPAQRTQRAWPEVWDEPAGSRRCVCDLHRSADGSRLRAADRAQRCMWGKSPGQAGNRANLGEESGPGPVWREVEGKAAGAGGGKGEVT